ncbi:hypothetical protein SAMN05518856_103245 [Paenibacillus sp. OK003]|nr:hypothetical protein SAMN05518856_103245 [Paenibacillus sp. OK003]
MIQKYVFEGVKLLSFLHLRLEGCDAVKHRYFFGEVSEKSSF